MAGAVVEHCAADKSVMKAAEIYNPFTVVPMIAKIMLPHHMSEQDVFRASITFEKPLLKAFFSPISEIFVGT